MRGADIASQNGRASHPRGCRRRRMRLGQPRARARSRRDGSDGGQRRRRLRWRGRAAVRLAAAASAPLHSRGAVWAGVRACPDSAAPLCRCGTEEQHLILAHRSALCTAGAATCWRAPSAWLSGARAGAAMSPADASVCTFRSTYAWMMGAGSQSAGMAPMYCRMPAPCPPARLSDHKTPRRVLARCVESCQWATPAAACCLLCVKWRSHAQSLHMRGPPAAARGGARLAGPRRAHLVLAQLMQERLDHAQRLVVGRAAAADLVDAQTHEELVDRRHDGRQVHALPPRAPPLASPRPAAWPQTSCIQRVTLVAARPGNRPGQLHAEGMEAGAHAQRRLQRLGQLDEALDGQVRELEAHVGAARGDAGRRAAQQLQQRAQRSRPARPRRRRTSGVPPRGGRGRAAALRARTCSPSPPALSRTSWAAQGRVSSPASG